MEEKKIKILIVDDDEIVRGTYADIFRQEGFEVSEAVDGLDGIDKATREIPDIIFSGIIMPRMDGFALKESLAKNVTTSSIPVMILSHMGREEDRIKAQELGVKDFIVQGMVMPKQVVERIRNIFGSAKYQINFSSNELDASKIAQEFSFGHEFECVKCQTKMVLGLEVADIDKKEFKAKFVCPKCG